MKIENVIFGNLINNEEYARKVIPFLQSDYFSDQVDRTVFDLITDYVNKYNSFPTKTALDIDLNEKTGLTEDQFKRAKDLVSTLDKSEQKDMDWLVDSTEKFCKDKALYNALMQSIQIVDDNKKDSISVGAIPKILQDALGVSFDNSIGHDFLDDADARYEFYHRKEVRIPFDLDFFNKITQGGLPRKTLNIALAGTGVGKSLFMCHSAAQNLMSGLNVLYITMEMAEERIAERIDANLLGVTLDELKDLPQAIYYKLIGRVRDRAKGKLIVKEYPTATAGSANFRHLLNELNLKKNFVPDIIYIDYLNICASSRIKAGSNVNSYTYIKAIAEELRGLAVEFNVPIVSATQTTRSGYSNSDVGLEDTSESFGLPATADFMFALVTSEELRQLDQIMVKQLKNRYGDPAVHKRFVIGVDYSKMRLYNVEASAQEDLMDDDTPVFDKSSSGSRLNEESKPANKFGRSKFEGFK
jgi:replicative DNA helicase